MKLPNGGYWMGWVAAVFVAALGVVALAARMFWSESFCTGQPSEHCVRDWLSATGSWAAVPAALLSVVFLSRQISEQQRQHIDNKRAELEPFYNRAVQSQEIADELSAVSARLRVRLEEGKKDLLSMTFIQKDLAELERWIEREVLRQFAADRPTLAIARANDAVAKSLKNVNDIWRTLASVPEKHDVLPRLYLPPVETVCNKCDSLAQTLRMEAAAVTASLDRYFVANHL
jgi:hypothetical protein